MPERENNTRSIDGNRTLLKVCEAQAMQIGEERDSVDQAIKDLEDDLAGLRARRSNLDSELSTLARLMSRAREWIWESDQIEPPVHAADGEQVEAKPETSPSDTRELPQDEVKMRSWSRMTAVAFVLQSARGPLSPTQIAQRLAIGGRDDEPPGVSVALHNLSQKGRAHRVDRAMWVAGPGPDAPSEDPVGTAGEQAIERLLRRRALERAQEGEGVASK
jgi:hypothetical protein